MDVIEICEDLEQLDGLEGTQMWYTALNTSRRSGKNVRQNMKKKLINNFLGYVIREELHLWQNVK